MLIKIFNKGICYEDASRKGMNKDSEKNKFVTLSIS